MAMSRILIAVVLPLAGCTKYHVRNIDVSLGFIDGACPSAIEATPALFASLGATVFIDDEPCTVDCPDDLLSVSSPRASSVESCCYAVACTGTLDATARSHACTAACLNISSREGTSCDDVRAWGTWSRSNEAAALAASVPSCQLKAEPATPRPMTTLRCDYALNVRYACSTEPG